MRPGLRPIEKISCPAEDNDLAVFEIVNQHSLQVKRFRAVVYEGDHDDAETVLEFGVLI